MQEFRPIDSVEALQERMTIMRRAQREFAKFTQEQVDHIFFEAAMAANKARIPLAKMAVEETGMGVMEDKVIKNHYASEYIYHAYRNTKTVGVLEEDPAFGIKKIAEPIGLVAAVIPTTNPTSTAIFKALLCLKTRNAILISPHPRAKKCTAEAAPTPSAGLPEEYAACTMPGPPVARMISASCISSPVNSRLGNSMQPMMPSGAPALTAAS